MDSGSQPQALPDILSEKIKRRYLINFDTAQCKQQTYDLLVIGSGIAGLTAALTASTDHSVALVTKSELTETNTWLAQGGIAGAVGEADSVELHLADTLVVGQGLCSEAVVSAVVGEAPEALAALQRRGVRFDFTDEGALALAREGGHSLPRVLHSGDATGAAVQRALTESLLRDTDTAVFEHRFLVDLLTDNGRCVGALIFNTESDELEVFWTGAVVLATGGVGQVWRVTTNPLVATGDGLAAAWRAGAEISDIEFMQFHPTALDSDAAPRFLITEALRGEGAYLLNAAGERFMIGVHPLAELAPRDVVSREIERVMAADGRNNVMLDARHLGGEYLRVRFPTIWQGCLDAGYNLGTDLVPVAPAAHYMAGGVCVDIDGRTSVPGLYASGEVSASGLHGANRLASNSLLEGLVFSRRIARILDTDHLATIPDRIAVTGDESPLDSETLDIEATVALIKDTMQRYVGVGRDAAGLAQAAATLAELAPLIDSNLPDTSHLELANLITTGALITHAAWIRAESRGCHFRRDFPIRDDEHWRTHTILHCEHVPRFEAVKTTELVTSFGCPTAPERI